MNNLEAKNFSGLPEATFEREQRLKSEISRLKTKIFEEEQKGSETNKEKIANWHNQIFDFSESQKTLSAEIAQKYPKYSQLRKTVKPISVAEIQAELEKGTCVLAYFYDDENLFRYLIEKNEFSAQRVDLNTLKFEDSEGNALEAYVSRFRSMLRSPLSSVDNYLRVSHQLLNVLFYRLQFRESNKIVVIPDKMLSLIPFEALAKNSGVASSFSEVSFLGKSRTFSYAYSATLWQKQNRIKSRNQEHFWAGFAPNYADFSLSNSDTSAGSSLAVLVRASYFDLPGAKSEVAEIAKLTQGKTFVGNEATKANFEQFSGEYQILHLAMHTLLENQNPLFSKLIFSESADKSETPQSPYLTISELYNLQTNADLAVLSACNTGYGKVLPGEGILSLSQAFTASGCPATIMSLWKVPDLETSKLMVDFYKNLAEGNSKSEALAKSKRNYLVNLENDRLAHPYFWAGFVVSGNTSPIEREEGGNWWIWVVLGLVGLGGFLVWRRKK